MLAISPSYTIRSKVADQAVFFDRQKHTVCKQMHDCKVEIAKQFLKFHEKSKAILLKIVKLILKKNLSEYYEYMNIN